MNELKDKKKIKKFTLAVLHFPLDSQQNLHPPLPYECDVNPSLLSVDCC